MPSRTSKQKPAPDRPPAGSNHHDRTRNQPQPAAEPGGSPMKCQAHNTDSCRECCPAMRAAWTPGQLKAALAGLPDDTPLAVNAVDTTDPAVVDEQVIVG